MKVVGDTLDGKLKEANAAADGARDDFEKVNSACECPNRPPSYFRVICETLLKTFRLRRTENPRCNRQPIRLGGSRHARKAALERATMNAAVIRRSRLDDCYSDGDNCACG